jgi:hypothetical protein
MKSSDKDILIWCLDPLLLRILRKWHIRYAIKKIKDYSEERIRRIGIYSFCIEDLFI